MDARSNRLKSRIRRGRTWIAALAALALMGLALSFFISKIPTSNPIQQMLKATHATAPARTTTTATASPTTSMLPVAEILARSRATHFKDMSGTETVLYGDGGSTRATIAFTSNPNRSEEVDSQFAAQGRLVEVDDVIKDGARQYERIISYRTNPPTDSGWKLDPQPVPDPRPLSVFLLDPFKGDATLIGREVLHGVSVYHLRVQLGPTSKQEVWIRTDNFYFAQWKETDSFSQALITMTAWDSGIHIVVPAV